MGRKSLASRDISPKCWASPSEVTEKGSHGVFLGSPQRRSEAQPSPSTVWTGELELASSVTLTFSFLIGKPQTCGAKNHTFCFLEECFKSAVPNFFGGPGARAREAGGHTQVVEGPSQAVARGRGTPALNDRRKKHENKIQKMVDNVNTAQKVLLCTHRGKVNIEVRAPLV